MSNSSYQPFITCIRSGGDMNEEYENGASATPAIPAIHEEIQALRAEICKARKAVKDKWRREAEQQVRKIINLMREAIQKDGNASSITLSWDISDIAEKMLLEGGFHVNRFGGGRSVDTPFSLVIYFEKDGASMKPPYSGRTYTTDEERKNWSNSSEGI